MKSKELIKIIKKYPNYTIESDSGWEVDATDIDAAWISHEEKNIVLVQYINIGEEYRESYEMLYRKDLSGCLHYLKDTE